MTQARTRQKGRLAEIDVYQPSHSDIQAAQRFTPRGETLLVLEFNAAQNQDQAEALLKKALVLSQNIAEQMGHPTQNKSSIRIKANELQSHLNTLQKPGYYQLTVSAAQDSLQGTPLAVQLSLSPKEYTLDPFELLEAERTDKKATHHNQNSWNTILAQAAQKRKRPLELEAPTTPNTQDFTAPPPLQEARIDILNLTHQQGVVYGMLVPQL